MSDLMSTFSRKAWKGCCTKGCKKCELAQAYIGAYGRGDGLARLKADRKTVLSKAQKDGKKARGKKGKKGKKRGGKK